MISRAAVALPLLLVLAGCGFGAHGAATVWVTRDRGARVLLVRKVPAGLTAMQALERVADVSTKYAGRYVEAIDGVRGSLTTQRDWFYFINGYESDRSAAEYRLHAGDVEWWDYRAWRNAVHVPIVVGAFPEPFAHGWNGHARPTYVLADEAELPLARTVARAVHGHATLADAALPSGVNMIVLRRGRRLVRITEHGDAPGNPVTLVLQTNAGDPLAVLNAARFHFTVGG